jgi:septal ring factor EnvC (AmiA/AmiB activator)
MASFTSTIAIRANLVREQREQHANEEREAAFQQGLAALGQTEDRVGATLRAWLARLAAKRVEAAAAAAAAAAREEARRKKEEEWARFKQQWDGEEGEWYVKVQTRAVYSIT